MHAESFWHSLRYAAQGIVHTVRTQRNARIHLVILALVVLAGVALQLSLQEWALVTLISALVLSLELVNSALEHLADKVEPNHDPHIMRAKDAAAGAVLIAALAAVIIGVLVFGPHLLQLFF